MSSKMPAATPSSSHPPIGTLIDGGCLELVEVLGVGGYGIVYRAVETRSRGPPKSFAVKCLISSGHQTARQRQVHIREVALHQIASAHPGIVTLHKVVESSNHTYVIMDFAPDHDLFTQILHSCRYLGDDALIKHVFLQLLDAVEYCHSLGIYHRDLKPENILCFDNGLRIAITDFGLATTDKLSDEFRTGSVYHMSPECQGGEFAPSGQYSPMFNDIWSLGIILLNLATGRNPWKSATLDDPTFQAYLRDPIGFLPTVLPISREVNDILVRMLDVDWRQRMTLRDVRRAIQGVESFYSDGAIFEGSMARCPWEAGMDIDSDSSGNTDEEPLPTHNPHPHPETKDLKSRWSTDSTSDIVFASRSLAEESSYGAPWTRYSSAGATWAFESSSSVESNDDPAMGDIFDHPSSESNQSPASSPPSTPDNFQVSFDDRTKPSFRAGLTINTNLSRPRFLEAHASMASFSTHTSLMHTAIEYDPYDSLFSLGGHDDEVKSVMVMPVSAVQTEDKEMTSPTLWMSSRADASTPSLYSASSEDSSVDGNGDMLFTRSATPSPELSWSQYRSQAQCLSSDQSQPSSSISALMTDVFPSSRPSVFATKKPRDGKSKAASIFPLKLFPRSPPSAPVTCSATAAISPNRTATENHSSTPHYQTPSTTYLEAAWGSVPSQPTSSLQSRPQGRSARQPISKRSPRQWFISSRLFALTGNTTVDA